MFGLFGMFGLLEGCRRPPKNVNADADKIVDADADADADADKIVDVEEPSASVRAWL